MPRPLLSLTPAPAAVVVLVLRCVQDRMPIMNVAANRTEEQNEDLKSILGPGGYVVSELAQTKRKKRKGKKNKGCVP